MPTIIKRHSFNPKLLQKGGPHLRIEAIKIADNKYRAQVIGQEHVFSVEAPTSEDAVRTLQRQVQEKFSKGNTENIKQTMV